MGAALADEIPEARLDAAGSGLEPLHYLAQDHLERRDRDLQLSAVENLDETRPVRALAVVRQPHVHVELSDRACVPPPLSVMRTG
jgi:hypothetical protein